MRIAIPRAIDVGGVTYQVSWDDKAREDLKNEVCSGRCNKQGLWIHLDPVIPRVGAVFLHEVTHCIDYEYCHNGLSENDVDAVATGLAQVLKQLGIEFVLEDEVASP